MKKRIVSICLVTVFFFLSTVMTFAGGSAAKEATKGGYEEWFYTANNADLDTADPYGSTGAPAQFFTNLTFDTVTYVDSDTGKVVGQLAESWKDVSSSKDGAVWEFYLRPGVTFHNGDKMTAEDVKFTWEYAAVGAGKVVKPLSAAAYVSSMEVVNDLTIRYTLKSPMPDFPSYLETKIFSKKAFDTMPAAAASVIGTGPYFYDRENTKSGVQFVATRYDKYWEGIDDYKTKHICFKVIPDLNTTVAALQAHELDLSFTVPVAAYKMLTADKNLNVITRSGAQSWYLGFNYSRDRFKNLELRKAIAQAINKETLSLWLTKAVSAEQPTITSVCQPGWGMPKWKE